MKIKMKIKLFVVVVAGLFLSACGSMEKLAANEFDAACDQTQGCKLNQPDFLVDLTNQVIRDDRTGFYHLSTAICAHRAIPVLSNEESACVTLTSTSFLLKSAVEERKDELTFQNIVASKEAWMRELPGVKYRF